MSNPPAQKTAWYYNVIYLPLNCCRTDMKALGMNIISFYRRTNFSWENNPHYSLAAEYILIIQVVEGRGEAKQPPMSTYS